MLKNYNIKIEARGFFNLGEGSYKALCETYNLLLKDMNGAIKVANRLQKALVDKGAALGCPLPDDEQPVPVVTQEDANEESMAMICYGR